MFVKVSCCTWNVNGGTRSGKINEELGEGMLADWLLGNVDRRKALYPFPADSPGDLALEVDEIVEVTEEIAGGEWLKGKCHGKTGIFPASFVEKLNADGHVATFDFEAGQEGDLSFVAGQSIRVTDKSMGDWWKGETQDGTSGIFPAAFVELEDHRNKPPDVLAVAFQEIVDLTADNIAKASTKNLETWTELIEDSLVDQGLNYVHLRSEQLVGAAIALWVRQHHVHHVRNLSFTKIKTGINAGVYTGGNKGALLGHGLLINIEFL